MSDDLIKRLREADSYNKKYYALDPLHQEAADRIEHLERENARLRAGWTDANARALAARLEVIDALRKLAKAVEALRFYASIYKDPFGNRARAVLAELEETHD